MKRMNSNKCLGSAILIAILALSAMLETNIISINPAESHASQVSSIADSEKDLIYIYTGQPIPPEKYVDYADVTNVTAENKTDKLWCTITVVKGPPVYLNDIVLYTFMFDENNYPNDNCMNYPVDNVDTRYTVTYKKTEGWKTERAKYQASEDWWNNENTNAGYALMSSEPGAFTISMWIPLTELPGLTSMLPWKVKTETFALILGVSSIDSIGDLAPDAGLAYLGAYEKPNIVVTNLFFGQIVTNRTQNVTGYVLDPLISEITYGLQSLVHEVNGTATVLGGNFTFWINLTEGHNMLTLSDGINEKTLVLTLDTSAPLVTFMANQYFNCLDSSIVFSEGWEEPPDQPPSGYDGWKDKKQYYGQGTPSAGLLKTLDRDYYKNGKKACDDHVEIEYYETGPAKGKIKKKTTSYTDENGVIKSEIMSETIEYEYDAQGRPIKEVRTSTGAGQYTTVETITKKYDQNGRLIERVRVIEADGRKCGGETDTGYTYDEQGRPTKFTRQGFDPSGQPDGIISTVELEYDANGRVTKRTVTLTCDGSVTTTTTTYEYDGQGRLTKIVTEQKWHEEPTAPIEKTTTTVEYSDEKVKQTTTKNPVATTVRISEDRYQSNFPTINGSSFFAGKVFIADISSNPMISSLDSMLVTISIVNATGNFATTFQTMGDFDLNMTLSPSTTLTIMVMDEAGNIGIKTFQISKPLISDLNGDHRVNMQDIGRAAWAFQADPWSPRWDFFADVNNDDKVDMKDIAIVAKDFGKTY